MNEQDLEIRVYGAGDIDAVIRLWRSATVVGHPFQGDAELDRDEELIRNQYIRQTETWCAWRIMVSRTCGMRRILCILIDASGSWRKPVPRFDVRQ